MASVFALQCSTSSAMKTHTWRAGQLMSSSTHDRNETQNEMNCELNLSNCDVAHACHAVSN